jgi:hypothetical protein
MTKTNSITALLLNTLKNSTLGAPAAEEDNVLLRSFVVSDAYDAFKKNLAFIAIGARGSGKSAIFRKLAVEKEQVGCAVVEIKPDHYSYEMLGQVIRSEVSGNWAKQAAYSVSWKYVLIITALKALCMDKSKLRRDGFKQIYGFLASRFFGHQDDPKELLISYLKRLEQVKIAGTEVKLRELDRLYKLEELEGCLPQLSQCLDSQHVAIFVDELDRGWDNSEDAKHFVAGLFQAAIEINRIHPNLRVYISLRQELYDTIPEIYQDAQKIRNSIRYLKWNEDDLKRLAEQRLAAIFSDIHFEPPSNWWNCVFEETIKYRKTKSFNYFVDRTTYRPREIILFLNECIASHRDIGTKMDYGTISSAEYEYSKGRNDDIAAEFRFLHPGLNEVFERFRGANFSLTREELDEYMIEILVNPQKYRSAKSWLDGQDESYLLRVLWSCGFLKAYIVGAVKGNVRPGSQYVGYHQLQSTSVPLDSIKNFHIHPMFRAYLGLKEKKS